MQSSRLPRFKRVRAVPDIDLTERDRQIIRVVHRCRFLRTPQIAALLEDSSQQLLRRLQLLYHHGFLERPRCQVEYYGKPGSRHIVYGIGNKGGKLLKQELGSAFRLVSWGEKNRAVRRIFLEHALLVSDVMVAIELACRKCGVRLLTEQDISGPGNRFITKWDVRLSNRQKLTIVPDRIFALEFRDQDGNPKRTLFFLEADRGTMPVRRRNLSQTSFFRKLLAYEATWSEGIHRSRFGSHRFRVLTVTSSTARVKSLLDACSDLERGKGLFLFGDRTALEQLNILFDPIWQNGRDGGLTSLLP